MSNNLTTPMPRPTVRLTTVLAGFVAVLAGGGLVHAEGTTILYYELEDVAGTVPTEVLDSSGNGRHGTVVGAPVYQAEDPGAGSTALRFTPVPGCAGGPPDCEYVEFEPVPELAELAVTGDVTVEAIVRPQVPGGLQPMLIVSNWHYGGGRQFALYSEFQRFVIAFQDGEYFLHTDRADAPTSFCIGRWYHLAGVRDSQAGEVRFYIDGELVDTQPLEWGLSSVDDAFAIGARYTGLNPFGGDIAEVRISNAVLDPSEFLPTFCRPDLDGNGEVGVTDLLELLAGWGQACQDLDGDDTVGVIDLLQLLAGWGPCP